LLLKLDNTTKIYPKPKYDVPVGASFEYVLSLQARNRNSTIIGFIVHENGMLVFDNKGKLPSGNTEYKAFCSVGMSSPG
jgi:hypothetical protein